VTACPTAWKTRPVGSPLKDPDNTILPDLAGMGASSSHSDIFMEFNGLWA
jgi:hypothetical protein